MKNQHVAHFNGRKRNKLMSGLVDYVMSVMKNGENKRKMMNKF